MPLIASTPPTSRSAPEYRIWAEQFLARYAILVHKSRQPTIGEGHSKSYAGEILAPLRAWAELARSNTSKTSNVGQFHKSRPTPKRQIWQLYYNTLSVLLQQALPYPAMGHGPSTAAQEMSTDNVKSVENLKLQQSIELRRVEGIYEDILLKEISFPKASEASVEVESWADQVMANWRVISGPSWQNEDLGRGGKDAVTRNVLAVCSMSLMMLPPKNTFLSVVEMLSLPGLDPLSCSYTHLSLHLYPSSPVHCTYRACRVRTCRKSLRHIHRIGQQGESSHRKVWRG